MNIYISRLPHKDDWVGGATKENEAREHVKNMLFRDNELRQGWGYPTLDLRVELDDWIQEAQRKDGLDIPKEDAIKRYKILKPLLDVKKGDVILIPTINKYVTYDTSIFTVVTIDSPYNFQNRSQFEDGYKMDFGHYFNVNDIRSFSKENIEINFQPYQKCFNKVDQKQKEIFEKIDREYISNK